MPRGGLLGRRQAKRSALRASVCPVSTPQQGLLAGSGRQEHGTDPISPPETTHGSPWRFPLNEGPQRVFVLSSDLPWPGCSWETGLGRWAGPASQRLILLPPVDRGRGWARQAQPSPVPWVTRQQAVAAGQAEQGGPPGRPPSSAGPRVHFRGLATPRRQREAPPAVEAPLGLPASWHVPIYPHLAGAPRAAWPRARGTGGHTGQNHVPPVGQQEALNPGFLPCPLPGTPSQPPAPPHWKGACVPHPAWQPAGCVPAPHSQGGSQAAPRSTRGWVLGRAPW